MGNIRCIILFIILLLIINNAESQISSRQYIQTLITDTAYIKIINGLYSGKTYLNSDGDSVRVYFQGLSSNSKIIPSWNDNGFLGELGVRNVNSTGFTIFSNTDEIKNIEIIYLIIDLKPLF